MKLMDNNNFCQTLDESTDLKNVNMKITSFIFTGIEGKHLQMEKFFSDKSFKYRPFDSYIFEEFGIYKLYLNEIDELYNIVRLESYEIDMIKVYESISNIIIENIDNLIIIKSINDYKNNSYLDEIIDSVRDIEGIKYLNGTIIKDIQDFTSIKNLDYIEEGFNPSDIIYESKSHIFSIEIKEYEEYQNETVLYVREKEAESLEYNYKRWFIAKEAKKIILEKSPFLDVAIKDFDYLMIQNYVIKNFEKIDNANRFKIKLFDEKEDFAEFLTKKYTNINASYGYDTTRIVYKILKGFCKTGKDVLIENWENGTLIWSDGVKEIPDFNHDKEIIIVKEKHFESSWCNHGITSDDESLDITIGLYNCFVGI